jgi:hypothetical protein
MIDKIYMKIAWLLPHHLVKWCFVRVFAHATQGPYDRQIASELSVFTALKRWTCTASAEHKQRVFKPHAN